MKNPVFNEHRNELLHELRFGLHADFNINVGRTISDELYDVIRPDLTNTLYDPMRSELSSALRTELLTL